MNQINPWLWIGDANDGRNVQAIKDAGITAVFNATQETDGLTAADKAEIGYLRLDQQDGMPIPFEKLDLFAAWLAVQGQHGRHVLIHCGAGISRAATFATVALMLVSAMSWDDCLAHVQRARPQVGPAPALKRSVLAWYAERDGVCHKPAPELMQ